MCEREHVILGQTLMSIGRLYQGVEFSDVSPQNLRLNAYLSQQEFDHVTTYRCAAEA